MTLRTKKIILVVVGIVVVILMAFVLFKPSGSEPDDESKALVVSSSDEPGVVSVSNIKDFEQWLPITDATSIEHTLYTRVTEYDKSKKDRYEGIVRQSSFGTKYSDYDDGSGTTEKVPTVEFIVDIPEAKQSYKVSQSGGDDYSYSIAYVVCPSSSELKYGDFGCVNKDQ